MINIIMHGCNGKMGQVITGLAANDDNVAIVAGVDINTEANNGYPVFKSIKEFSFNLYPLALVLFILLLSTILILSLALIHSLPVLE